MIVRSGPVVAILLAIATMATIAVPAPAQDALPPVDRDPFLIVTADREAVTIGDPVELTVRLIVPPGVEVKSFSPGEAFAGLSVLDRRQEPRRTLDDGRIEEIHRFRVAGYDLDGIEVPLVEARLVGADGTESSVTSAPLTIAIAAIVPADESEPSDIKNPATMPLPPLWPWVVAGSLLLAALGWWLWRRRRKPVAGPAAVPASPPRPEHEVAYEALERLLSSGLLERGGLKEFYIEMAEILKNYLGARFRFDTFERTSNEILEALRGKRVSVKVKATSAEFFVACDVVKFARHHPESTETRTTVECAYRLIDETKRMPPPREAPIATAMAEGKTAAGSRAR